MNTLEPTNNTPHQQIKDEAAEWFAKLNNPTCSTELEHAFQQWLKTDPLHASAYEQCKTIWIMSNELINDPDIQRELTLAKHNPENSTVAQPISHASTRRLRYMQYAATVFIAVTLAIATTYLPADKYSTQVGEQRLVKLTDGSTAMLNTDTVITVHFDKQKREIKLEKGEVYFDVMHDSQRPFEVLAAGNTVRALGTEFNVALNEQEITVAVTEGLVAIETHNPANQDPQIIAKIKPGEAIKYTKNGPTPIIQTANLERISAWKVHKIYFNADRLQDAVKEYNRYFKGTIQIADDELKDQLITGVFNIGDIESFLFTLEHALDARIVKDQNRILVLKKNYWPKQANQQG